MPNHKEVIPFPTSGWRFFDYADEIEKWYLSLTELGQDTFDALLKANQKVEVPLNWTGSKPLQEPCKSESIWEWYFKTDGIQHRVLGIFGESKKKAIFLIACSHKQKVYRPPDCQKTAIKRARQVREGKATLNERKVKSNI